MPMPTIIFDIDDSLAPSSSCGDNNRQLTFPAHTKNLIETLQNRGVNCLFISNATTSSEIQALLQTVGVQVSINNIYSSKAYHDKNNVLPELTRIVALFRDAALFRAAGPHDLPEGNITAEMTRDNETLQTMAAQFIEKASVAEAWLTINVPGYQLSEVMLYDDSSEQCTSAIAKGMHTIKADRAVTDSYPAQQPVDMPQQFVDIQTWVDEISLQNKLDHFFHHVKANGADNIKNITMHKMLLSGPAQHQSGLAFLADVAEAASKVSNFRAFLAAKMPGKSDSTAATLNDIHQAVKKQNWTAAYKKLDSLMDRTLQESPVVFPANLHQAIDNTTSKEIGNMTADKPSTATCASSSTVAQTTSDAQSNSSSKPAIAEAEPECPRGGPGAK